MPALRFSMPSKPKREREKGVFLFHFPILLSITTKHISLSLTEDLRMLSLEKVVFTNAMSFRKLLGEDLSIFQKYFFEL